MASPQAVRFAQALSRYTRSPGGASSSSSSNGGSSTLPSTPIPPLLPSNPNPLLTNTASWSLSFYPQPLLNLRRRSTTGTTPAFPFINTFGFISYLASTLAFYASPLIRRQYAARNPSAPDPAVRTNDVVYAAHAVLLSTLVWSQYARRIWGFEQGRGPRESVGVAIRAIAAGCVVAVVAVTVFVATQGPSRGYDAQAWAWIDVVYAVSYIKLFVTVIKYIPQVQTNYERKSTVGLSMDQVILDIVGGVLSVAQLLIDSLLQGDWSGVTGNPVKLGLGNVSVVFDVIFVLQRYVFYPGPSIEDKKAEVENGEGNRLLHGRED
ncbi:MAG: hypothetical protein LQ345_002149 [Seirophora villosa]|nr:MAG: hypothetical protein LQ345_002149 [Seirophora villosa]